MSLSLSHLASARPSIGTEISRCNRPVERTMQDTRCSNAHNSRVINQESVPNARGVQSERAEKFYGQSAAQFCIYLLSFSSPLSVLFFCSRMHSSAFQFLLLHRYQRRKLLRNVCYVAYVKTLYSKLFLYF